MRLNELEIKLEGLSPHPDPEILLEQYQTPPELAARILHTARINNDLDVDVVDLGCGGGILGVGAALLGSKTVVLDIDIDALRTAVRNAKELDVLDDICFVQGDVSSNPICMDDVTVVMNPPFGVQKKGADRDFLDAAAEIASVAYTIHNEGSKEFIESYIHGEITHAFRAFLDIPRTYEFHKEERKSIPVEVYRIEF